MTRARLAVRRRLERRARADPARGAAAALHRARAVAAAGPRRARRAAPARVPAALRPARRGVGARCRSSGSASGSSPSTTTTSPCSRSGTAGGATRTCASSRGSRAPTRSCAAPTSRASSASSTSRRRSAPRELEAVAEEEGADAVRLLTIHAAKGLEFKVVVVADAGPRPERAVGRRDPLPRRRPLRLPRRRPGDGQAARRRSATRRSRTRAQAEDEAERLRLYYVAMTRAIDRLIVSGLDRPRAQAPTSRRRSAGCSRGSTAPPSSTRPATGRSSCEREGARVARARRPTRRRRAAPVAAPQPCRPRPRRASSRSSRRGEAPPLPPLRPCCRADPGAAGAAAPRRAPPLVQRARALRALLVPLLRRARRRACARPMRRGDDRGPTAGWRRPRSATPCTGCSRWSTSRRRAPPDVEQVARAGIRPSTDEELEPHRRASSRVLRLGARAADRGARGRARRSGRSRSSTTASCCTAGSTSSTATARARSCSTTRRTRSPRARPRRSSRPTTGCSGSSTRSRCFRAGAEEVEVVYHFLERPDAVVSTDVRARPSVPALEAELSEAIARIRAGEFVPTPSEFACAGCPALDVVCAGPRLGGAPPEPAPAFAAAE